MIRVHISSIHNAAPCRKPGYVAEVMKRKKGGGSAFVDLTEEDFHLIRSNYQLRGQGTSSIRCFHDSVSRLEGCKCKARMCQMDSGAATVATKT